MCVYVCVRVCMRVGVCISDSSCVASSSADSLLADLFVVYRCTADNAQGHAQSMLTRVYSKVTGKAGSQDKNEQPLHISTGGKATSSHIQKLSSYGDSVHAATAWTKAEHHDGTPDLHHGLRPQPATASHSQRGRQAFPE